MRFKLTFNLKSDKISRDYRSGILSYFKFCLESNDKNYLEKFFSKNTTIKSYTWSTYMGACKFLPEYILIENKRIILNFSCNSNVNGIIFFNSFMGKLRVPFPFGKDNSLTLEKIEMVHEKEIEKNITEFKTLSHIVVKTRIPEKNRDHYLTFLDEGWEKILKQNLKFQLKDAFEFDISYDIDALKIDRELSSLKKTVITNYGISFPVTHGIIVIEAEKYLLDYFLKSGLGSKTSSGFGMLEKIESGGVTYGNNIREW